MTIKIDIEGVTFQAGNLRLSETAVLRRAGHIPTVRVSIGNQSIIAQDRGAGEGYVVVNETRQGGKDKFVDHFDVTEKEPVVKIIGGKTTTFTFISPRSERLQRVR